MRILFYVYELPPLGGGVANAAKNILDIVGKNKSLRFDVITGSIDGKEKVENYNENIQIHYLNVGRKEDTPLSSQKITFIIKYMFKSFFYTWKLQRNNKYDLAHVFGYPGGLVSMLYAWKLPYIVSLRGVDVPGYNPKFDKFMLIYRPISWLIWKFAREVIVNSRDLADLARKTAKNIDYKLIPNGVDTDVFRPAFATSEKRSKFSVTAGGTLFGPKKGLKFLISGFAKFHDKYPNTELVLFGGGDLETELKAQVSDLGKVDSIKILGRKDRNWIEENLPKFHVFCLPSINEGMSNAALEGLASGLPMILTDTGGASTIIRDNGFLVQKKSSSEITTALEKLYNNPKMRQEFSANSRKIAESMSWQTVADQYYQAYNEQT